jgi:hypothetical protein
MRFSVHTGIFAELFEQSAAQGRWRPNDANPPIDSGVEYSDDVITSVPNYIVELPL